MGRASRRHWRRASAPPSMSWASTGGRCTEILFRCARRGTRHDDAYPAQDCTPQTDLLASPLLLAWQRYWLALLWVKRRAGANWHGIWRALRLSSLPRRPLSVATNSISSITLSTQGQW